MSASQKSIRDGRPVSSGNTITPSDSDVFEVTRAVLVGVAGNVKVTYSDDSVDTIPLAAGVWHPMAVKKIWSTGTTATGIHIGY